MKVYVASSWRNAFQSSIVHLLRVEGHEVYDFKNPDEATGFNWWDIDPNWEKWSPKEYRERLDHPLAMKGFKSDMDALRACDAVVGVQPFGRSASLELGWAVGAEKFTVLLLANGEPELMVKMCDHLCIGVAELVVVLREEEASWNE